MREQPRYLAGELTRFKPLAPKYYGYTAMDWFKFYGFFAGMILMLAFVYIKYLGLFEDIETQAPEYKLFALAFSTVALLVVLPAALGFLYWAAGALVRYSLWQQASPRFWRWFWFVVLLFYFFFEFDPLDKIHPAMSRQGLLYVPKLIMLIFDRKLEFTLFQMGYFLLWMLFWFLVVMLHMSYILRGLAVIWFYTKRFNRYGASLLVGFRETLHASSLMPVTREPGWHARLKPVRFRGVPCLAVDDLSAEEARAIVAADLSAAIVPAPGQAAVLFIDLGRYDYDPALAELRRADGQPLLSFEDLWADPAASREELLVPLRREARP